jgi:hypothetical protein
LALKERIQDLLSAMIIEKNKLLVYLKRLKKAFFDLIAINKDKISLVKEDPLLDKFFIYPKMVEVKNHDEKKFLIHDELSNENMKNKEATPIESFDYLCSRSDNETLFSSLLLGSQRTNSRLTISYDHREEEIVGLLKMAQESIF